MSDIVCHMGSFLHEGGTAGKNVIQKIVIVPQHRQVEACKRVSLSYVIQKTSVVVSYL